MAFGSESEKIRITVRDLDVDFGHGDVRALTLYPRDEMTIAADGTITIKFVEKSPEEIVLHGRHIHWYSLRDRTITIPKPDDRKPSVQ